MTDMSAEERERANWILARLRGQTYSAATTEIKFVAETIRQAEAAARKAALEEAAQCAEDIGAETPDFPFGAANRIAKAVRALAESEKP